MPVLVATDPNSDMGAIAEKEGFGLWSLSGDLETFMKNLKVLTNNMELIEVKGEKGSNFLLKNYIVDKVADIILQKLP